MRHTDTPRLVVVIYLLTLLFLGLIYLQGSIDADPVTLSNLEKLNPTVAGSSSAALGSIPMSGETALITLVSVTLLFGCAFLVTRSRAS